RAHVRNQVTVKRALTVYLVEFTGALLRKTRLFHGHNFKASLFPHFSDTANVIILHGVWFDHGERYVSSHFSYYLRSKLKRSAAKVTQVGPKPIVYGKISRTFGRWFRIIWFVAYFFRILRLVPAIFSGGLRGYN